MRTWFLIADLLLYLSFLFFQRSVLKIQPQLLWKIVYVRSRTLCFSVLALRLNKIHFNFSLYAGPLCSWRLQECQVIKCGGGPWTSSVSNFLYIWDSIFSSIIKTKAFFFFLIMKKYLPPHRSGWGSFSSVLWVDGSQNYLPRHTLKALLHWNP